jgi:hypothetical protein
VVLIKKPDECRVFLRKDVKKESGELVRRLVEELVYFLLVTFVRAGDGDILLLCDCKNQIKTDTGCQVAACDQLVAVRGGEADRPAARFNQLLELVNIN